MREKRFKVTSWRFTQFGKSAEADCDICGKPLPRNKPIVLLSVTRQGRDRERLIHNSAKCGIKAEKKFRGFKLPR